MEKIKKLKLTALTAAAALLCGCTAVPDRSLPAENQTQEENLSNEAGTSEEQSFVELPAKQYELNNVDFSVRLNAEGGAFEGNIRTDGEYDGKGYIVLDEGMQLSHIASPEASQHYCVAIAAHSYGGASVRLKTSNEAVGTFYIPASASSEFTMFAVDNVYLAYGPNILNFEVTEGSAAIDYIDITNSSQVKRPAYYVSSSCISTSTAVSAIGLMKYLTDTYGSKVISGQCVTPGTNAEIEVIAEETGRTPAIRTGDLMYCTPAVYKDNKQTADSEIQLALDWGKNGGIVSMGWHWFAPTGRPDFYAKSSDFVLADAVTDRDISMADEEELNALRDSGIISDSAIALIRDIDAAAQALAQFRAEGIPVLFQPIPDGDTDMYWWSGSPKNYRWLWSLVFNRLDRYHSLNNLIWVWNGSSTDYFPGKEMCDIIGQGFFENSSASFAGRFSVLAGITGDIPKVLAITSCDKLPSPDYMRRDNAMWLWFSIASGNTIIDSQGNLSEKHTSWKSLHDAYNSALCITLDELPDLNEYAFED